MNPVSNVGGDQIRQVRDATLYCAWRRCRALPAAPSRNTAELSTSALCFLDQAGADAIAYSFAAHAFRSDRPDLFGKETVNAKAFDLTRQHKGEPIGERIIVSGRVMMRDGRPCANTLVEIWQTNAAGRYLHKVDQHDAPVDPNFSGGGHTLTDSDGIIASLRQTGRISVAQPLQCVATSAYSLFVVRAGFRDAAGDPDVFSGRPVDPLRSDFQLHGG